METPWTSRPNPGSNLDKALIRLVIWFRVLGWLWMGLLVALTIATDDGADQAVVIGSFALATVWVGVTMFASTTPGRLGRWWFVALDGCVVVSIGAASTLSGATDLFHGGFLISWIVLAAYAGGRALALAAALILTVEQVVVHLADDRGLIPTAGSVIFFILALIVGWAYDTLRALDKARNAAVKELDHERVRRVRQHERAAIADELHDTVLQSLHAIRLAADDPSEVQYLARRQERELRLALAQMQSEHDRSFRVALLSARDEVEDIHRVEVGTVLRCDAELTTRLEAVVMGAREAMLNAAAHSGERRVEVYSECSDGQIVVRVRDRGIGMDTNRVSTHRGIGRAAERLQEFGGTLDIVSNPGEGTECAVRMPTT